MCTLYIFIQLTLTDPDKVIPMPSMAPPARKTPMCLDWTQLLKEFLAPFRWFRVTGSTAITMNPVTPTVGSMYIAGEYTSVHNCVNRINNGKIMRSIRENCTVESNKCHLGTPSFAYFKFYRCLDNMAFM